MCELSGLIISNLVDTEGKERRKGGRGHGQPFYCWYCYIVRDAGQHSVYCESKLTLQHRRRDKEGAALVALYVRIGTHE